MTDYLHRSFDFDHPAVVSVFDEMSFWSSKFAALIFENLEFQTGLQVLDVGCGTGCPTYELAHLHGASCQFTGVDIWKTALERACAKNEVYQLPNVRFIQVEPDSFPFEDEYFDLVVSNLGINNFEYPDRVLSECARVSRPEARLVMTTNIKGHMREFYAVYREVLDEIGKPQYLDNLALHENHRGTYDTHVALIKDAGFRITRVIEGQFSLRYLNGSAFFRHSLVRFGFLLGWRNVVTQEDEDQVFSRLEERLNEIARIQGELRMTIPMLYLEARRI